MRKYLVCLTAAVFLMGFASAATAATNADIVFVIDQSGSMSGEFNWLGSSISTINSGVTSAGITANYGVAGYVQTAGTADSRNVWVDVTSDINAIVSGVNAVSTYGSTEKSYHAVDWAANNFSWTGGTYAKVMILITDEDVDYASSYQYGGLTGEAALAKMVADYGILLNVITSTGFYTFWDGAVYTNEGYVGLFDLQYLRDNAAGFTEDFIAAKTQEIQEYPVEGVPEPGTVLLLGLGLAGIAAARKKFRK